MKLIVFMLAVFLISFSAYSQSSISKNCIYDPDTLDGMEVCGIVEIEPKYNGGKSKFYSEFSEVVKSTWINQNVFDAKYIYTFVIDTTGSIRNFCVIRPQGITFDQEKLKILNNWSPGIQGGRKVPVRMIIPVTVEPG